VCDAIFLLGRGIHVLVCVVARVAVCNDLC